MAQPGEWTADALAAVLPGHDPEVVRRMSAGIALLGHPEEPAGSCVLVADSPHVQRLADLPRERRLTFLRDLDILGEAVHNVCRRLDARFRGVDLQVAGDGELLLARVRACYAREGPAGAAPDSRPDDLRSRMVEELDRICAAARADYPAQHVYGSRPTHRAV